MKKLSLILVILCIFLAGCQGKTNAPSQETEPECAVAQDFMVAGGRLDTYIPASFIYTGKPQKISSVEELSELFKDSDILPAMQTAYDATFFKSNVLIVYGSSQKKGSKYQIASATVLGGTRTMNVVLSSETYPETNEYCNYLFCMQYRNGIVGAIQNIGVTVK